MTIDCPVHLQQLSIRRSWLTSCHPLDLNKTYLFVYTQRSIMRSTYYCCNNVQMMAFHTEVHSLISPYTIQCYRVGLSGMMISMKISTFYGFGDFWWYLFWLPQFIFSMGGETYMVWMKMRYETFVFNEHYNQMKYGFQNIVAEFQCQIKRLVPEKFWLRYHNFMQLFVAP